MSRYKVVTWHGESGTVFYCVDLNTDNIVKSFRNDRKAAEEWCEWLNQMDKFHAYLRKIRLNWRLNWERT